MTVYDIRGINPVPWTASKAARRKGGLQFYKDEDLKSYQKALTSALEQVRVGEVITEGPIVLRLWFWRQLELTERDTGAKVNVRAHQADATNMQKAAEDAIQGALIKNDRDVAGISTMVVEQGHDTEPRILIEVYVPTTERNLVARLLAWAKLASPHRQPVFMGKDLPPQNEWVRINLAPDDDGPEPWNTGEDLF